MWYGLIWGDFSISEIVRASFSTLSYDRAVRPNLSNADLRRAIPEESGLHNLSMRFEGRCAFDSMPNSLYRSLARERASVTLFRIEADP